MKIRKKERLWLGAEVGKVESIFIAVVSYVGMGGIPWSQWPPLSSVVAFIAVEKYGLSACVYERVGFVRGRWYLIGVRVSALWVGEDEVGN